MVGVLLCGGRGTRLKDLTKVVNKHLLPVFDRPMCYYPLQTLYEAGIRDCLIVTNPSHVGQFHELLGDSWWNKDNDNVDDLDMKLSYAVQNKPTGGIADAIGLAEGFAQGEDIMVCLGDNIFIGDPRIKGDGFGAQIWVSHVEDPTQYGVVTFEESDFGNLVKKVVEKPKEIVSPWAQTGLYFYPDDVFDKIKNLKPSERGELEVTDLNNLYAKEGRLYANIFDGEWIDSGTNSDELLRASQLVKKFSQSG